MADIYIHPRVEDGLQKNYAVRVEETDLVSFVWCCILREGSCPPGCGAVSLASATLSAHGQSI
jgi:hypothetical protein